MPEKADPLYEYLLSTPGLKKLGLLFGSQLYEVAFDERGQPVGGEITLQVLQLKLPLARSLDGILIILSQGPMKLLLGRDENGEPVFRDRLHMKGLVARHNGWFGLSQEALIEAFELDRRLKIIARPTECHRIDACEGLIGRWSLPEPRREAV